MLYPDSLKSLRPKALRLMATDIPLEVIKMESFYFINGNASK